MKSGKSTYSEKDIAFVFPGQGAQHPGMGAEFIDSYPLARETFDEANDILGFDLENLCTEGPVWRLNLTENTQPALLTVGTAIFRVIMRETCLRPAIVAGHSLGEYTALVAAGVLRFEDALRLVQLRGRLMQQAVPEGRGAMAAILGLALDRIEEICRASSSKDSVVVPANINSHTQVVISGDAFAVGRAAERARKTGARRIVRLAVSVPSHSPLMKVAAERLAGEIDHVKFNCPSVPVITNVEAKPEISAERIKRLLIKQLYHPVKWLSTVNCMRRKGMRQIVEVGPGKVLAGLIKRIDSSMEVININDPDDLPKLKVAG